MCPLTYTPFPLSLFSLKIGIRTCMVGRGDGDSKRGNPLAQVKEVAVIAGFQHQQPLTERKGE